MFRASSCPSSCPSSGEQYKADNAYGVTVLYTIGVVDFVLFS
jgi:hypothetical protein